MIDEKQWLSDTRWEADWWGNCANTYREESLQIEYAKRMQMPFVANNFLRPSLDLQQKSVIDIGGGPVSMLLKATNFKKAFVVDPCEFPAWVRERYRSAGVIYMKMKMAAEKVIDLHEIDEVWIYNVLQHTMDPVQIINNAKQAKRIRIFEWVDTGTAVGHPHNLTEDLLNEWLGGKGTKERFTECGADGWCYYGVFENEHSR